MQLFYREKGDSFLPPLILLHGLWGASDNWLSVAEKLAYRFHVLLPDWRNHGRSPHAPSHTYPDLCSDLLDWMEGLHLRQRPFIAGHSMGGKCLMQLLLRHPERAAKAAVIDIAPKSYDTEAELREHSRLVRLFEGLPLCADETRASLNQRIRNAIQDERTVQIVLKNISKEREGFRWKVNIPAIAAHLPCIAGWEPMEATCPLPVLFIRGAKSDYIREEDAPTIKRYFPAASFRTIPDSTHWVHAEQPERLAAALKDFFTE